MERVGLHKAPMTLPVFYNGRKIALAVLDQTVYSFNLPHSLSYLVQMGGAVPTLVDNENGAAQSSDGSTQAIVLVDRPQEPRRPFEGKIRVRQAL